MARDKGAKRCIGNGTDGVLRWKGAASKRASWRRLWGVQSSKPLLDSLMPKLARVCASQSGSKLLCCGRVSGVCVLIEVRPAHEHEHTASTHYYLAVPCQRLSLAETITSHPPPGARARAYMSPCR